MQIYDKEMKVGVELGKECWVRGVMNLKCDRV